MNKEIEIFDKVLSSNTNYFQSFNYTLNNKAIREKEYSDDIFYEYSFYNSAIEKKLIFYFFPSTNKYQRVNEVYVFIKNEKNSECLGLPEYLAFKELNRSIEYKDTVKYLFKINPNILLNEALRDILEKVITYLNNDLRQMFTSKEWLSIPTKHPQDEY